MDHPRRARMPILKTGAHGAWHLAKSPLKCLAPALRKLLSVEPWVLLLILLLAAAVRFYGLTWDHGIGAHPDERYIVDVAGRMSFPSRLNPFEAAPGYAYGHLPLYLLRLASAVVPAIDPLFVGRALSAILDVGTVALTFALAKEVVDERVGLLAAALVAFSLAHVQQAHFYTVDVPLVFFTTASLLFAARFSERGRGRDLWLAGALGGLAVGAKSTGILLGIPLMVACFWRERRPRDLLCGGLAAAAAFVVVNPFAVAYPGTFVQNLARQSAIVRGSVDVPYTLQYHGTLAYIYPWVQQLRWGLGWLVGSCAVVGLIYEAVRAVAAESPRPGAWVLLAWVVPTFALVGGLYAKFPRYVLPILPVLAIYAAAALAAVREKRPMLFRIASGLLVGTSLMRTAALAGMYQTPHPWVAASEWLSAKAAPGARIAVEAWDHPLPVQGGYELLELPVFDEESDEKWEMMNGLLERADYLVVASRRGYGALAQWSSRYPSTTEYYGRLFRGDTGFEAVACFGRFPHIGPLVLKDDPAEGLPFSLPAACGLQAGTAIPLGRLDESFVVYDHPQVVVFERGRD